MCAKQGIALRGHRETAASGCNRGNFLSFLELVSEYDPIIQSRLLLVLLTPSVVITPSKMTFYMPLRGCSLKISFGTSSKRECILYKQMRRVTYQKYNSCHCVYDILKMMRSRRASSTSLRAMSFQLPHCAKIS